MHRNFFTCPYLNGSKEGGVCRATSTLIKDIGDIDLAICMSRHYEVCYIYYAKLQEIAFAEASWSQYGGNQMGITPAI